MPHIRLLAIPALTVLLMTTVSAADPKPIPLKLPDGVTPDQLSDVKVAAKVADQLEKDHPAPRSEAARMLIAILRGSQLNGGDGWFGPAESRYTWDWLTAKCGVGATATAIPRKSFPGPDDLFDKLDRDGDGTVTPADLDWSDRSPYVMRAGILNGLFRRLDTGGDGKLTREEFDAFFKRLSDGKESFTADDLRGALIPRGPGGFNPLDAPTVPVLVRGLFAGEVGSMSEGPKLNATAPPFKLKSADGKGVVELAKLVGPKPVVLVFGNFTCGPFRALYPDVEAVQRRFKDRATFVMVYVREAHPTDGWKMGSNARLGVAVKQPTTNEERLAACAQFRKKLDPALTVAVDDISDPAGTAYSGMPARLYVIDAAGKVAFKSGRGPFGFKPGELEQALTMSILETVPAKDAPAPAPRLPLQSSADAWRKLPDAPTAAEPLPAWARALVGWQPVTTARMLELDALHRSGDRLDARFRAVVRWAAADANRCRYATAMAEADYDRATGHRARLDLVMRDEGKLPEADRLAAAFARRMMRNAAGVTDAEVKRLIELLGEERMMALVALVAHASFQDRVLLALGVSAEADGVPPPVAARFGRPQPGKPPAKPADPLPVAAAAATAGWEQARKGLEEQSRRPGRIAVPAAEAVAERLGKSHPGLWQSGIVWSRVAYGYQPQLTDAWFDASSAFRQEGDLDGLFTNSLFWVVTDALNCFY